MTLFVIIFSQFYSFSKAELVVLFLTISSVIGFEIINTSIETLVNLVSPEYNSLAKITKDAAAGAVLVSSLFAISIAVIMFWNIEVFKKIYLYFSSNTISLIGIIILAIISYIFVFRCFKKLKIKNNIKLKEVK